MPAPDFILKLWGKADKVKVESDGRTTTELMPVQAHLQEDCPVMWIVMDGKKSLRTFGRVEIEKLRPLVVELVKRNPGWIK
jgi:hypothetical protein